MILVRPRLNDFYNIPVTQEEVDFAIPFIDEDIPLYIDPFLLWKSKSQQDNALHLLLINTFNFLGNLYLQGDSQSVSLLVQSSECNEVGLGNSKKKSGKKISAKSATEILSLYKDIPQINKAGLIHFEEIQLFVENIAEDRVSDFTASFIKSFLIDFTLDQCQKYGIPTAQSKVEYFDLSEKKNINETVLLPNHPVTKNPILLVPKRWLRFSSYINYEDYFKDYYKKEIRRKDVPIERIKVLTFNRHNYDMVQTFIKAKERDKESCKNDPLFKQIPVLSAKRKLQAIFKLPTGKINNADKEYEESLGQMLASMFYPHLDFAQEQSRTESGVLIRDLIFYNNKSFDFLKEIYERYECHQIVIEMKNVNELSSDHIDQLNRYLKDSFGRFGVVFTRNEPPKKVLRNTIDLWSGQRKCILILSDEDLKLMTEVYESRQRSPIEVLKKKYIEFTRLLPS